MQIQVLLDARVSMHYYFNHLIDFRSERIFINFIAIGIPRLHDQRAMQRSQLRAFHLDQGSDQDAILLFPCE